MNIGTFMKFLALCGYAPNGGGGGGGAGLVPPGVVAMSAAQSSVTGTTNATVLATVGLPAIAAGTKLRIHIDLQSSVSTSKLWSVALNGNAIAGSTESTAWGAIDIAINCPTQNSQNINWIETTATGLINSGSAHGFNLAVPSTLTISCTPGTTAETDSINGYSVELLAQ